MAKQTLFWIHVSCLIRVRRPDAIPKTGAQEHCGIPTPYQSRDKTGRSSQIPGCSWLANDSGVITYYKCRTFQTACP
ncbi:hypothetical protein PICMEDRAFT_58081 [Pichia membranifaciens NRRL Y-2026]|uniref:Uncharacterized protein n=1 Tax=Pichia membranifaciens NRRL Y-2026 TaxID=763406 RepID=A0A1E3NPM9_9ASCO|nr:hypothetical protein PICMEDRAFT_58081 [Pichia membranifaciens NRRL Y-2026]ODQ47668.1 hypothetical protein PICMEDRAFT_58081 [Pichia membranifaciens NRRL Y-2026]